MSDRVSPIAVTVCASDRAWDRAGSMWQRAGQGRPDVASSRRETGLARDA